MSESPPPYDFGWVDVEKEEIIDAKKLNIKKIYVKGHYGFSIFPMISMDGKNFSYLSPFLIIKGSLLLPKNHLFKTF